LASRFFLVLRAQTSRFFFGDCRWTVTGILEDEPERAANLRRRRDHVVSGDARRALRRLEQRAEDLDGRRLASAVGTEKSEDLACWDRERDVIHSRQVAEAVNQPLDIDGKIDGKIT
jgi:hypothetical protein